VICGACVGPERTSFDSRAGPCGQRHGPEHRPFARHGTAAFRPLALRGGQEKAGGVLGVGLDSGGGAGEVGVVTATETDYGGGFQYQSSLAGLQNAVVAGIRRGASKAELAEELLLQLIRDLTFADASVPDDFSTAMRRLLDGNPVASVNWTCAACSMSSASHTLACCGCGMQRSLAERVVAPEHVHVNVPDDAESLAEALDRAQAGMQRGWNAAGRSARISLRSGSHTWAKELLVFCNMTLCFEGLGFQGCQGGRSEGRWWWLQGSQGRAEDMLFSYHHPHRSPAGGGVPKFYLDRDVTWDDQLLWLQVPATLYPELIEFMVYFSFLDHDVTWDISS
jgi:hypothetical protein